MKQLTPSPTVAISSKAYEMRKAGIHIYNFSAGDPILPNHPAILAAAQEVLHQEMSPYAPVAGLPELRKAAAEWMNRRYTSQYNSDETLVTAGGKFGIYAAIHMLVEPQDEVLIIAPYWVSYPEIVQLAQGVPKILSTSEATQWKISAEDLRLHLTKRTKVLILNNGCNPTGALYSKKEIEDILALAKSANIMVISDEVYSELVFDGHLYTSCAAFPEYTSHVIIIESCSKNFGMAGWRVGFAFGPEKIIKNMNALQSQSTTGCAFISQKAALGALLQADVVAEYVRQEMGKRRQRFFETYNRLFFKKAQANPAALYFFTKVKGNSAKVCEEILTKSCVALVPGIGFGMEGYVRFAFSEEESEIIKGLTALQKHQDLF